MDRLTTITYPNQTTVSFGYDFARTKDDRYRSEQQVTT